MAAAGATPTAYHLFTSTLFLLLLLLHFPSQSHGQQTYVNNHQLACDVNSTDTFGFTCNAAASCRSYLTFRSTPTYNSPATIAYLLSADAGQISAVNNITDVDPLPDDTLVIVPINCSCFAGNYYQHNASYTLRRMGETYFSISNNTYQALTTCQAMEAQNPSHNLRTLVPNLRLSVPLRCACVTRNQSAAGFRYLLTYLVRQGNTYSSIAQAFSGAGATVQGILDANELTENRRIFFFTPLLVPLTVEPTYENINTGALPPLPPPSPPSIPTNPAPPSTGSSSRRWVFVGVGIGVGIFVLFCSGFLLWLLRRKRRSRRGRMSPPKLFASTEEQSSKDATAGMQSSDWSISSEGLKSATETLTVYKFEDLEKATGSFAESNRIRGSSVYHGSFNGDDAAVKIMKGDVSREINVLRLINHSHIIRLSGFCLHQGITYLVYEYAQNGSLSDLLHDADPAKVKDLASVGAGYNRLDWKQRVQIAYDVADALNYLHNFTNPPHIHKDLKSGNVLLDANMRAKVANFGLTKTLENDDQGAILTRHVVGTYGYMAPEYIENGLVTPKLDVFAFGVVMLELLSGKEATVIDRSDGMLSQIIERVLSGENVREKLREFIDPWLGEEYPLDLAYTMAELAKSCVAQNLNDRPSMSDVFMALSKLLSSSLDWDPSHNLQNSASFSLSD